ncbi:hypothetical protein [Polynucleobacter sp. MWH-UH23A]|uniref:hypothetical protein n=1 Tax=Polynucleobacter sp. MWH-UH23A TaxID=1855613 RepID=UPI003365129A
MRFTRPASHFLFIIFLLSCLAACAGFPDKNQDSSKNNVENFRKDLKECKDDYPEAGSGVHIREWINCMNLKGWK